MNGQYNILLNKKDRLLCVLSGTSNFKLKKSKIFNPHVLLGKVMFYNNEIDLKNLIDNLSENNIKKFNIFIITKDLKNPIDYVNEDDIKINGMNYFHFLTMINLYINDITQNKTNSFGVKIFLDDVFHNLSHSNDIKPLFIFEDLSWFNIVKLLKSINVNITGGNTPRIHLLSSLEYDLSIYLNGLFKYSGLKINEIRKIIYQSYNTKFITKTSLDSNDYSIDELSELEIFNLEINRLLNYIFYLINNFNYIDNILEDIKDYENKLKLASINNKKSYLKTSKDITKYRELIHECNLKQKIGV